MSKESTRQVFGTEVLSREVGDFRLVECLYDAASEMPRHTHDISHISVVLRGSYTERYGQRERGCEVSTLIVHPPGEDHHVRFHAVGARIFSIHLKARWVGRVRDHTKILDTPAAFRGWPSSVALKLYRELRERDAASPLAVESLVLGIVAEASRQAGTYERRVPRWLERVRDLLHARFAETVIFSELAAAAGVHPVYLAREFRRHFGCTAGEYVRRLRVEAACREISGSDAPLSAIASSVGFYDQSHLSNVFKRLTGMSPARYRRAMRSS